MLEDILIKRERNYLKRVIKSYKDEVSCIERDMDVYYGYDTVEGEEDEAVIEFGIYIRRSDNNFIYIPLKDDNRFAGMQLNRKYTLEELGLC